MGSEEGKKGKSYRQREGKAFLPGLFFHSRNCVSTAGSGSTSSPTPGLAWPSSVHAYICSFDGMPFLSALYLILQTPTGSSCLFNDAGQDELCNFILIVLISSF